jgi:hypothetical protein
MDHKLSTSIYHQYGWGFLNYNTSICHISTSTCIFFIAVYFRRLLCLSLKRCMTYKYWISGDDSTIFRKWVVWNLAFEIYPLISWQNVEESCTFQKMYVNMVLGHFYYRLFFWNRIIPLTFDYKNK